MEYSLDGNVDVEVPEGVADEKMPGDDNVQSDGCNAMVKRWW